MHRCSVGGSWSAVALALGILNANDLLFSQAELWEKGFQHVAGVDEAGRGPLAGPVVAAACIIPSHITIDGSFSFRLQ